MKEINDVAPTSLSHVACESNRGVIEQCRIAIDAAFEDNRRLDSPGRPESGNRV